MEAELTGNQCRAARGFLRWSVAELAEASGVAVATINRIETGEGVDDDGLQWRRDKRAASIAALEKALIGAGVTFLHDDGKAGSGIRVKPKR